MDTFVADLKQIEEEEKMDEFQEFLDKVAEATNDYIDELSKKLNVSESCESDIY